MGPYKLQFGVSSRYTVFPSEKKRYSRGSTQLIHSNERNGLNNTYILSSIEDSICTSFSINYSTLNSPREGRMAIERAYLH